MMVCVSKIRPESVREQNVEFSPRDKHRICFSRFFETYTFFFLIPGIFVKQRPNPTDVLGLSLKQYLGSVSVSFYYSVNRNRPILWAKNRTSTGAIPLSVHYKTAHLAVGTLPASTLRR